MRILVLFILMGLQVGNLHSQAWRELLPKHKPLAELTFYDYQQAFNSYWAPYDVVNGYYEVAGEKIKAAGWKQFKRWEYWMSFRIDRRTGALPQRTALEITKDYFEKNPPKRSVNADWKSLGPHITNGGYEGIGRLNCIAFHPTDTSTLWVGAASGGLWVSYDSGSSWTCLTDMNESLGISDIIIAPDFEETQIIYIATGDRASIDNNSVGVLKSTDAGQTWNETGLHFELAEHNLINRLLQHPGNLETLFAASPEGVFKTTDGGVSWDEMIFDREFIDMEFHPTDPLIMYGGTRNGELFRSLNGGDTWTRTLISNGARTEIAVSPAQPSWVYLVSVTGGLKGIYKSEDSGATFAQLIDGDTLNMMHWNANAIGTGGQGYYDLAFAASPYDANIVFLGGVNTWRSMDGGVSWKIVSHFAGSVIQTVHADKHALRFHPNGELWECNDGGVYITRDTGTTWIDKTNGMAISQIYKFSVSASDGDLILIGMQDNGSKMMDGGLWEHVNGGDGTDCMINPNNADIQFSSTQSGSLFRTLNRWGNARYVSPPNAGAGNWVTPFVMDPNNPDIIYGGYKEVWKSTDRGDTWAQVSTLNALGRLEAMAIAPSESNVVYVAESGRMWRTTTGGEPFESIYLYDADISQISSIAVKHDDPNTFWVTCGGYWSPGVHRSTDGGETFENISAGLPPIPVYTVVENKQASGETELYAGTELGVFMKKGEEDWVPFNTGFANVIVTDLEFYYAPQPDQTRLRASTYGRGVWETRVSYSPFPMSFVSSVAEHPVLDPVNPGWLQQQIVKVEIATTGDQEPLYATQISFTTEGSTNALTDIANARLFYSGHIDAFTTTMPFGETVLSPNGSFVFSGNQVLNSGSNYFWLVYDIAIDATVGNEVDAICTGIQLDASDVPFTMMADGARLIDLLYCDAGSTLLSQEHISHVVSDEVDQVSMKGLGGYENYTNHIIALEIGEPKIITVTNASPHNTNELIAWVDWNRDGDFYDADERQYDSGPTGISQFHVAILPPAHARIGQTRMRIRLHDITFGPNGDPCGISNLGEVEDYTVDVQEVMTGTVDNTSASIIPIYPNPVSDEINLPAWIALPVRVEIINSVGIIMSVHKLDLLDAIDVRALSPDVYVLRITAGDRVYLARIIVF